MVGAGRCPLYALTVSEDPNTAPHVLDETVTVGDGTTWSAVGLVRNESAAEVGAISVTATLRDPDGKTLDTATADARVPEARPGEPVPFDVRSDVATEDVASIAWSAKAAAPTGPIDRDIESSITDILDPSRKDPVDDGTFMDADSSPYPYVAEIFLHSLSDQAIDKPRLIVAWFDTESGALLSTPTEATVQALGLGLTPDMYASATVVVPDPPAEMMAPTTEVAIWGYGQ